MKLSEFNQLSIIDKVKFIKGFLPPDQPGIANKLIFEDYSIDVICSLRGHIVDAFAILHNNTEKKQAQRLLGKRKFVAMDCSNLPVVKEKIVQKIFSATHRNN